MFGDLDWLQQLVNLVSDYVYVKDRQSRFVMANDKVAEDMGPFKQCGADRQV